MTGSWNHKVFTVSPEGFEPLVLEIFRFQARENQVYKSFIDALGIDPDSIQTAAAIPFLPIRFFKSHDVQTTEFEPGLIFESSGTTGMKNSRHLIKDILLYEESFLEGFEMNYGSVKDWCILGLLPSYLEKGHSSLVYMVDRLINLSGHKDSGFYLHDHEKLEQVLTKLEATKQKTLFIGVTYALMDFAEKHPISLRFTTVLETGGMKGRREEMVREEVHAILKNAFGLEKIHSEYGMTELLSQAYSSGEGLFKCPPWMKIYLRDDEDPFQVITKGSGIINIIDLANIYSCSFIATDDAGRLQEDGSFEVLGRIDGSDLRGCSLLTV